MATTDAAKRPSTGIGATQKRNSRAPDRPSGNFCANARKRPLDCGVSHGQLLAVSVVRVLRPIAWFLEESQIEMLFASFRIRRVSFIAVLLVAAFGMPACVHVRPYQRERLSHNTMTTGNWGGPGEVHARSVHEGAIGGGSAGEAGCGCN